mmetsp:Transcript_24342/g.63471  ORF Transcript_24342/g.63471 Transcript_24342/m.63471 type:complete len:259 (-) Transcript_24342:23-799(-)
MGRGRSGRRRWSWSCATRSGRRTCPSYIRSAAPSRTSSAARREGDISVKSRRGRATASSRTSAGATRMASSSWAMSRRLVSARRVTGAEAPRRRAPWTPGPRRSTRICARSYARSIVRSSDARRTDRSSCGSLRSARSEASSSVPSAKFRRKLGRCFATPRTRPPLGPGSRTARLRRSTRPPCSRTAFTVAGASRRRASTPGSRSTASGSSAATRTSPTRPGTATTTHASTTGSKLTYTLAGDSSPVTPLGARPRNPN